MNHYRLDLNLSGKRFVVGSNTLGFLGLLVDGGTQLRLFILEPWPGEYVPTDKIRRCSLEVQAVGTSRQGAALDAVRRWNQMVRAATSSRN